MSETSGEDCTSKYNNDFGEDTDTSSEDGHNGPESMFSILKPFHVPGKHGDGDHGNENTSNKPEDEESNNTLSEDPENEANKTKKVPPPTAPKPTKVEHQKEDKDSFSTDKEVPKEQEILPSIPVADGKERTPPALPPKPKIRKNTAEAELLAQTSENEEASDDVKKDSSQFGYNIVGHSLQSNFNSYVIVEDAEQANSSGNDSFHTLNNESGDEDFKDSMETFQKSNDMEVARDIPSEDNIPEDNDDGNADEEVEHTNQESSKKSDSSEKSIQQIQDAPMEYDPVTSDSLSGDMSFVVIGKGSQREDRYMSISSSYSEGTLEIKANDKEETTEDGKQTVMTTEVNIGNESVDEGEVYLGKEQIDDDKENDDDDDGDDGSEKQEEDEDDDQKKKKNKQRIQSFDDKNDSEDTVVMRNTSFKDNNEKASSPDKDHVENGEKRLSVLDRVKQFDDLQGADQLQPAEKINISFSAAGSDESGEQTRAPTVESFASASHTQAEDQATDETPVIDDIQETRVADDSCNTEDDQQDEEARTPTAENVATASHTHAENQATHETLIIDDKWIIDDKEEIRISDDSDDTEDEKDQHFEDKNDTTSEEEFEECGQELQDSFSVVPPALPPKDTLPDVPPELPPKSEKVYESMKSVSKEDINQPSVSMLPQFQPYQQYWYGQYPEAQMYPPAGDIPTSMASPFNYPYQQPQQQYNQQNRQVIMINGQMQYVYPSMGYYPQQFNPAQYQYTQEYTQPQESMTTQMTSGLESAAPADTAKETPHRKSPAPTSVEQHRTSSPRNVVMEQQKTDKRQEHTSTPTGRKPVTKTAQRIPVININAPQRSSSEKATQRKPEIKPRGSAGKVPVRKSPSSPSGLSDVRGRSSEKTTQRKPEIKASPRGASEKDRKVYQVRKSPSSPSRLGDVRSRPKKSDRLNMDTAPAGSLERELKKAGGGKRTRSLSPKVEPDREYYIVVTNLKIGEGESLDNLTNYVAAGSDTQPVEDKIIYNRSTSTALLILSGKPNMEKLKLRTKDKKLYGNFVEVFEVEPPTAIAVSCEDDLASESLVLYFEAPRNNGGPITDQPEESEDQTIYIITFQDPQVVQAVSEKPTHFFEGKTMRVSPYYEYQNGAVWDTCLHALPVPDPVKVMVPRSHATYLKRHRQKELQEHMKDQNCSFSIEETHIELTCSLRPGIEGFRRLLKAWSGIVQAAVKGFLTDHVTDREMAVTDYVWDDLVRFLQSDDFDSRDIVKELEKDSKKVKLTGPSAMVIEKLIVVQERHKQIDRNHRKKDARKSFDPDLLSLPSVQEKIKQLQEEYKDADIKLSGSEVKINAIQEDIDPIYVSIYETVQDVPKHKVGHAYSMDCVKFVNSKPAIKTNIDNRILHAGMEATWRLDKHELTVYVTKGDPDKVREIVFDIVEEQTVDFEVEDCDLIQSHQFTDFLNALIESFDAEVDLGDVTFKGKRGSLIVYGLSSTVKEVMKQIKHFMAENGIRTKHWQCPDENLRFLQMHCQPALTNLEREYGNEKLKIVVDDAHIKLMATKAGIEVGENAINKLLAKIIKKAHTIQKVAVVEVFQESLTMGEVEKETRCVIKLQKEFEQMKRFAQDPRPTPENLRLSGAYYMGEQVVEPGQNLSSIKVSIVQGEIAKQRADILVAATSTNLKLGSGAAGKNLVAVGGEELQQECEQRYPKGIQHWDIAVINGSHLKCTKVYLTSLNGWSDDGSCKWKLQTVITNCLKMASKNSKKSICFAAMGTGMLKYPARSVARAMFQAVEDFKKKSPDTTLKDVKFVLHPKDRDTIMAFSDEEQNLDEGGYTSFAEVTVGPMKVELAVEKLEEQKVDCVLVTTNTSLNLGHSGACKALLQVGGDSLQQECKKYGKLEVGQIVEIGGGKLPCKHVFLTVLPPLGKTPEEDLTNIVKTFLGLAQAKKHSSVAMPALGTGYLRYPRDTVCRAMHKALMNFARENQNTCIKKVRFVMYSKDWETREVFQKHFERLKGEGNTRRNTRRSYAPPKQDSKFTMSADGCQIRQTILQVQQGDILESETDAIVSSCGNCFNFNGAVAQTMLKRCPKIQKDCEPLKEKFVTEGVATTKSRGLKARHIIHVQFQETVPSWKKHMVRCLEEAQNHKCKSVAFPVLGSGGGYKTFKPASIAECLFDATDEFTKNNPHTAVKDVRLVVFHKQPEMFKPVLSAIHGRAKKGSASKWSRFTGFMSDKATEIGILTDKGLMSESERVDLKKEASSMSMTIYSDDMENISKCITILDEKLEKEYMEKKIDKIQETVQSLKPDERKKLLDIRSLVDITVDSNSGIITVKGPKHHVLKAVDEIQDLLRKFEKERHEQQEAEMLHKQVQWFYEEITTEKTELLEYDKVTNLRIETAFKDKKTCVELPDYQSGIVYVVDFKELIEYVKGERSDQLRVLRKDVLKSGGAELPADWVTMGDKENVKIVPVLPTDPRYQDLEKRFMQEVNNGKYTHRIQFDLKTIKITKIERVQNKALYQQYVAKKKLMETQKPKLPKNMPIERDNLWHGTKPDAASSIKTHGFNRSFCGVNGVWFGQGVYFAKDASYSARGWLSGADQAKSGQTARGCVFSVKALTGQFCKGDPNMRYLGPVDKGKPNELYDSAVDDPNNPFEFVIFTDTQSYPDYLIEFTATVK